MQQTFLMVSEKANDQSLKDVNEKLNHFGHGPVSKPSLHQVDQILFGKLAVTRSVVLIHDLGEDTEVQHFLWILMQEL